MFPEIKPDDVPLDRRWRYHQIEAGHDLKGWVIGKLVMTVVHWAEPTSKPCRWAMTGGRLPCKCRDEKIATRKIGYLPVFSQSRERVVIILSNTVCQKAEKMEHGTGWVFKRSLVPCTPLLITEWPNYECNPEQTKRCKTWAPADIQSWLLHLWQDDVLAGYFAALRSTSAHPSAAIATDTSTPSPVAPQPPARDDVVSLKTPLIRRPRKKDSA